MTVEMRRVVLVTGGGHGIGAAIASRLSGAGWRVIVADKDSTAAEPPGGRVEMCDVADEAAVDRLVQDIRGTEGRLDAVVSNAGINIRKPIARLSAAEWAVVIGTNLTATFLLVRAAESLLRAAKGSVVTIASTRAHMSEPDTEAYAASKGGLVALTHALSISLAPDVRVNCISPGWILTKGPQPRADEHAFHPAGRVGTPEDVAGLIAFLLGPDSAFITGAEFVVDGGVTRKMIYPE
ncbi:MAG TPA: SDR family oxidoreductase [Acetobacteraceae bacterium]|nr:SDR family oxidoreductase [Acetobacteraceae bacterium]